MGATKDAADILEAVKEKYEPVIGLEVHVQLLTRSKIFCACSTRFGDPPNTNTCPVCLGLPGALPVLNREAVAKAVKAALALNCGVNRLSRFARKNYFYPDLPKGYQISQFDQPLAEHGWIMIHAGDGPDGKIEKRIGITRLHLEEDAGKSIHDGYPDSNEKTYVDLNRSGVPLAEIVSEPDLRSPEEAYDYVTRLKQILLYLGVSDCNMEEGSLRCDANVSVRPRGQRELGVKTEVKNLNSFRFLQKALEYEIGRQVQVLEGGGRIEQETRLWNTQTQRTMGMRSKEHAHDYRYFPEPDLLPLIVSEALQEEIRQTIPELPNTKRRRFIERYKLSEYDAEVLTATQELADYYDRAVAEFIKRKKPLLETMKWRETLMGNVPAVPFSPTKFLANWIMVNLLGDLKAEGKEINNSPITPEVLAELLAEDAFWYFLLRNIEELGEVTSKYVTTCTPLPIDLLKVYDHRNALIQLRNTTVGFGIAVNDIKKIQQRIIANRETLEQARAAIGVVRQIADSELILNIIRQVLAANPKQLEAYRAGKTSLFGFFVGQVMKETKGQANPQKVNELLKEELARN